MSNQVECTDLVIGTGIEVTKGCLVFIQYKGHLENGTLFDSTDKHGRPFEFVVGSKKVIQGMSHGVVGMKVGGRRKVFIPSELAYGERAMGAHIPPHSNLIFEVELLEARPRD